jgi:orotate phosphoribosyltransferase
MAARPVFSRRPYRDSCGPVERIRKERTLNSQEILRILEAHHALIQNSHIVYTSGKHGSAYVNKDAIYPYTTAVSRLCQAIADHFVLRNIEVVAAPALGGIILSQWTAYHLSTADKPVLAVFAEKTEGGGFAFRRGYDALVAGRRVLVVEDILTTGGSLKEAIGAVRSAGGEVVAAAALCNRGGVTSEDVGGVPELFALTEISLDSWEAANCPLCAQGVPINTQVGKGREFLARQNPGSSTDRTG